MEPKYRTNIKMATRMAAEAGTGAIVFSFITKHMKQATRAQKVRSAVVGYVASTTAVGLMKRYCDEKINDLTDKAITYVKNLKEG